ncbi:MAG: hypothetical protein ACEQSU_02730 [Microgenomates group bacterium]
MTSDYAKKLITKALATVSNLDVGNAHERLVIAAQGDDSALASTVREMLPLLYFGLLALDKQLSIAATKKRRGRPSKDPLSDMDSFRAFQCWHAVKRFGRPDWTNREALDLATLIENLVGIPAKEAAFSKHVTRETLEESLSRGKSKLGFSDQWACATCDEILAMP